MTIADIISIAPFQWHSIGTAVLCGFIIGLERQLRGKPVGIRTSTLITWEPIFLFHRRRWFRQMPLIHRGLSGR